MAQSIGREIKWSFWYHTSSALWKIRLTVALLAIVLVSPVCRSSSHFNNIDFCWGDYLSSFYFVKGSRSFMSLPKYNLTPWHVWNCCCRWYFIYDKARGPECLGLTAGLWGDYLMNSCFTAAVSAKSPGSKSGRESHPPIVSNTPINFSLKPEPDIGLHIEPYHQTLPWLMTSPAITFIVIEFKNPWPCCGAVWQGVSDYTQN